MKCAIPLVLAGLLAAALGASVKSASEHGVSQHIIGGEKVNISDRPYTVRMQMKKGGKVIKYCAAARLDRYWFVTAAECLDKEKHGSVQIMYPFTSFTQDYDTKNFNFWALGHKIHPQYNNVTKANNIAVFVCNYCQPIDQNVLPELPKKSEKDESFSNAKAVVSGWTVANLTAEVQPVDQMTSYNTTMVNSFVCKLAYFFRSVSSNHLCASSWGGKRVSEAHVGAPLVDTPSGSDSRPKLIGIASSIEPWTTTLPVPIVFTKIGPYVEWIGQETGIFLQ